MRAAEERRGAEEEPQGFTDSSMGHYLVPFCPADLRHTVCLHQEENRLIKLIWMMWMWVYKRVLVLQVSAFKYNLVQTLQ